MFGDANLDGGVTACDLLKIGVNWQISGEIGWQRGDFNLDAHVNAADLNALALNWQRMLTRRTAAAVPEPANWLLAGSAVWCLVHLPRRYLPRTM